MKIRSIFLGFILVFLGSACQTEDIPIYSDDAAGIYFQRIKTYTLGGVSVTYANGTDISFVGLDVNRTKVTYTAEVHTMGKVMDYNRPFRVEIDTALTTAVRGVHFDFNGDTLVMPAGKSMARVPVTFYRTSDLLENTYRVVLHLLENEHFKMTIEEYKNTNVWNTTGEQLDGTRFIFQFNEQYNEPSYWDFFGDDFFGTWTPRKYMVVNSVMGWTVSDWNNAGFSGAKIAYGRLGFAAKAVQKYLQEQADSGNPVKDINDRYMQLADAYAVDYSKYE